MVRRQHVQYARISHLVEEPALCGCAIPRFFPWMPQERSLKPDEFQGEIRFPSQRVKCSPAGSPLSLPPLDNVEFKDWRASCGKGIEGLVPDGRPVHLLAACAGKRCAGERRYLWSPLTADYAAVIIPWPERTDGKSGRGCCAHDRAALGRFWFHERSVMPCRPWIL